jgi:hypothetical protein
MSRVANAEDSVSMQFHIPENQSICAIVAPIVRDAEVRGVGWLEFPSMFS